MEELSREDFEKLKRDAEKRLLQMRPDRMPPVPAFVQIPDRAVEPPPQEAAPPPGLSVKDKQPRQSVGSLFKYLNIPEMLKNSDALLLLALLLLLSSEDADEGLLLALAYILL